MYIELTEYLLCPNGHRPVYCVAIPQRMDGRSVVEGVVGCPKCKAEFAISGGVLKMHGTPTEGSGGERASASMPDLATVHALLGVGNPGGYVVLVGSASHFAARLPALLEGVHIVCINSPVGVDPGGAVSLVESPGGIGLRDAMARGVVVGGELEQHWVDEALRVVLPGRHVLVLRETDQAPPGAQILGTGQGVSVFRKTSNTLQSS